MSLGRLVADRYNKDILDRFFANIDEATWPWRLWRPVITRDFDIVEGLDYVLIEARLGKNLDHVYIHRMPLPYDVEVDELVEIISNSFKHSFRSWRTEPAKNIVLGEN